MKPLVNRVALVTGATRGVGKGIAVGLGEAGATVYITGRSLNPAPQASVSGSLRETQAAVEQAGGVCIPVQVDHNDDQQVQSLSDRIAQEQGKLDILVNNAFSGVQALTEAYGKQFWQTAPSLWDACLRVGLRSHYVMSLYAAQLMVTQQQGLICTISSWGGLSEIFGVAYGVGKSGCDRLAAEMATELKPHGVTSLSVWPGIVGTEHIANLADQQPDALDPQTSAIWQRFNWETPLLTGRAIAALAADPQVLQYTGKVQIVAEVAQRYGLIDAEGNRPVSLRSLQFLLPYRFPDLRNYAQWIPDWKIPWLLLLWGMLRSPKI